MSEEELCILIYDAGFEDISRLLPISYTHGWHSAEREYFMKGLIRGACYMKDRLESVKKEEDYCGAV